MSTATTTTAKKRPATRLAPFAARAEAEAVLASNAMRPRLRREIDAVAASGSAYRAAEERSAAAYDEVVRLCGSDAQRKEIEDRARKSVTVPEELMGLRKPGKFITRMLITWSDGEVMHDRTFTEPPLADLDFGLDIRAVMDDPNTSPEIKDAMNRLFTARSNAWNSLYNDEQKAAYDRWIAAKREDAKCEEALNKAVARLMRIPTNTLPEIAAKVGAWGEAWGILKAGGKLATGQMEDWDNQVVLAAIGEDLLRAASQGPAEPPEENAPRTAEADTELTAIGGEFERLEQALGDCSTDAERMVVLEKQDPLVQRAKAIRATSAEGLRVKAALLDRHLPDREDLDASDLHIELARSIADDLLATGIQNRWSDVITVRPNDYGLLEVIRRAHAQGHTPEEVAQVVYLSPAIPDLAPAIYFEKPNGDLVIVSRHGTQTSYGGHRNGHAPDRDHWEALAQRLQAVADKGVALESRAASDDEWKSWSEEDTAILAEIEATPALSIDGLEVKAAAVVRCYGARAAAADITLTDGAQATTDVRLSEQIVRALAHRAAMRA